MKMRSPAVTPAVTPFVTHLCFTTPMLFCFWARPVFVCCAEIDFLIFSPKKLLELRMPMPGPDAPHVAIGLDSAGDCRETSESVACQWVRPGARLRRLGVEAARA